MATGTRSAPRSATGDQVTQNIATIAAIEQAEMTRRSIGDRVSGVIARFAGSMAFVALHASWFTIWITMNWPTRAHPFDPYPYNLLTLIVALEAIFLSQTITDDMNISGAENDDEMRDLSQTTDIADLAQAVDDTLAQPAGARAPAPRGGANHEPS